MGKVLLNAVTILILLLSPSVDGGGVSTFKEERVSGVQQSGFELFYRTDDGEVEQGEWPKMPARSSGREGSQMSGDAGPYLIDFSQWVQCYTFNNSRIEFAVFKFSMSGETKNVYLRCGTPFEGSQKQGWGYRHIEGRHVNDWQGKLDAITPPGSQPDKSWDDVMAAGINSATEHPQSVKYNKSNDTYCTVGEMGFRPSGQNTPIQWVTTRVAFSSDGDRVITAFPVKRGSVCP